MDQGEEKPKHPITGEPYDEEEERNRLHPIEVSETTSKEVQNAFINYCKNTGSGLDPKEDKAYPERLLLVHNSGLKVREYYSLYRPGKTYDFLRIAELRIRLDNSDKFDSIELEQYDENGDHQGFFYDDVDTSIYFVKENDALDVVYHKEGDLTRIAFTVYNQELEEDDDEASLKIESEALLELARLGKMSLERKSHSYTLATVKGKIILTHKHGNRKDECVIPVKISTEETINKLFNPITLKDPVNAPTDLDDSWKSANLSKISGIEWERH